MREPGPAEINKKNSCDCTYIIKIKIHSSCEIEDFVQTHLVQAVCDTPIARITGCVLHRTATPLGTTPV